MIKRTILALAVSFTSMTAPVYAAVIGNEVVARSLSDTYSNFGLSFTNLSFGGGFISSWSTYIGSIDGENATGTMGLLVLENISGDDYTVKGIDIRSVSLGLNQFVGTSIATSAGDILGIFMGGAKVSYDLIQQAGGPILYTANGGITSAPTVGAAISFNGGSTDRTYSVAAVEVPEVSAVGSLAAMASLIAFMALLWERRNRQKHVVGLLDKSY